MRKVFGRIWILVLALVILTATALPAAAATQTQGGVELTVTTDKQTYSASEKITTTITAANKNDFAVEDVKLECILPSGHGYSVKGDTTLTAAKLGAGEKLTMTVELTPPAASSNPTTGDDAFVGAWILLAVLSAALVTVLAVLYRKNMKVFSMLLCLVLVVSMLPVSALAAGTTHTLSASETVKADGKDLTIQAKVTFTEAKAEDPTEPAPTEPAPTEPAPTEPAPTEPAPTEPAPTEPAPTEPAPTEPEEETDPLDLTSMQIVLPANPTDVETTAAKELKDYINKMTGTTLSVVNEGAASGAGIYIGATEFAAENDITYPENEFGEGWAIKAVDGSLVLTGQATRGTLYATYHLLEDVLGVRWWNLWEEYVPTGAAQVPADYSDNGVPVMDYRDIYATIYNGGFGTTNYYARNRMNGFTSGASLAYGGTEGFGAPAHVHTFNRWFPSKTYFKNNPDWYAMDEAGNRDPNGQLCLSNEGLYEAYKTKLLSTIQSDVAAGGDRPRYYGVSPNDTEGHCACPDCKASMAAHGASGHLLQFVNRLAAAVEEAGYTDVYLETLAYASYIEPPLDDTAPAENVVIRFADLSADLLRDLESEENAEVLRRLKAWVEICPEGNLYIWEYGITGNTNGVFPNMYRFPDIFQTYAELGVNGYFIEMQQCINTDFWDLKQWIVLKLMEDPTQDFDTLLNDFIYGYYGEEAGKHIRDYLDYMFEKADSSEMYFRYNTPVIRAEWLTVEDIIAGDAFFEKAFEAAGDDETLLNRLRQARAGLDRAIIENYRAWADEAAEKGIEFTLDRNEIGARLATGLAYQVELRGQYDSMGESMYLRYKKYLDGADPMPEELQDIDPVHMYDYPARTTDIMVSGECYYVEDADSVLGEAVCVDMNTTNPDYWLQFFNLNEGGKGIELGFVAGGKFDDQAGAITHENVILDGQYHVYRFNDFLVTKDTYRYFHVTGDCALQNYRIPEDIALFVGQKVDFYVSMKVTGDVTFQDKENLPKFYIDRVGFIEKCSVVNGTPNDDASCTQDATVTGVCSICQKTVTVTQEGTKTGHQVATYTPDNNGTCLEDMTETGTCGVCGESVTRPIEGTKTGHSFVNYTDNGDGTKTAICEYGCGTKDTIRFSWAQNKAELDALPAAHKHEIGASSLENVAANGGNFVLGADPDDATKQVMMADVSLMADTSKFAAIAENGLDFFFSAKENEAYVMPSLGTILAEDLIADGNYHVYKIEDFEFKQGVYYRFLGAFGDALRYCPWATAEATKTMDFYISMRIDGDITCSDPNNMPKYYIEKIVFADSCDDNNNVSGYAPDEEATCLADATETGTCGVCGAEVTKVVEGTKKDHVFTIYTKDDSTRTKTSACDYSCGTFDVIPYTPEEEFALIPEDQTYVIGATQFVNVAANGGIHVLGTDPDDPTKQVMIADVGLLEDEVLRTPYEAIADDGLVFFFSVKENGAFATPRLGTIPAEDLVADGQYHVYKINNFEFRQGVTYRFLGAFGDTLRHEAFKTATATKTLDCYIFMRIDGDITCSDANNMPTYYMEKIVFAEQG